MTQGEAFRPDVKQLDTFPLTDVDRYNYICIERTVHIVELSGHWIKKHKISYEFENGLSDAFVSVEVQIKTFGKVSDELKIFVYD